MQTRSLGETQPGAGSPFRRAHAGRAGHGDPGAACPVEINDEIRETRRELARIRASFRRACA